MQEFGVVCFRIAHIYPQTLSHINTQIFIQTLMSCIGFLKKDNVHKQKMRYQISDVIFYDTRNGNRHLVKDPRLAVKV